ncbi:hypothetical protein HY256_12865, partial [Candidatus Sumerlaeota bacterium]|nr:hypothetical protein [Candidatus Sumerlaeota bacterium]
MMVFGWNRRLGNSEFEFSKMKFRFPRLFSTAVFVIAATVAPGQPAKGKVPADAMIVKDITPGVRGGRLLMGNAGDVKTFNPPLVDDTSSQKVMGFLFDALYGYDNFRQKDKSGLAKSWEYKAETREWVFHLREGLKWSDGQPLTSDDALFYTEVLADPKVPNSEWDYMKTAGKPFEFSAPDPLTF